MRTNANQCELPLDVDAETLLACKTEARAVQICLAMALAIYGRDQQTVAHMCGWKGKPTCLSEAASETSKRRIPKSKRARFTVATGCTLLEQFLEREAAMQNLGGHPTKRQQIDHAVAATMSRHGLIARQGRRAA